MTFEYETFEELWRQRFSSSSSSSFDESKKLKERVDSVNSKIKSSILTTVCRTVRQMINVPAHQGLKRDMPALLQVIKARVELCEPVFLWGK
jgi:hypothetical protein